MNLAELVVNVRMNHTAVTTGLQTVKAGLQSLVGVAGPAGAAIMGAFSLKEMIGQFAEAEVAAVRLKAAVESIAPKEFKIGGKFEGIDAGDLVKSLNDFADTMQRTTTIEDDAIRGLERFAIQMGASGAKITDVVQVAIGLNRALGIGMEDAIRAVVLEMNGYQSRLGKQIPALREAADQTQRLQIIQDKAKQGLKEEAALTETLQGKWTQLKNTLGDLAESLGESMADDLKNFVDSLKQLAEWLKKLNDIKIPTPGQLWGDKPPLIDMPFHLGLEDQPWEVRHRKEKEAKEKAEQEKEKKEEVPAPNIVLTPAQVRERRKAEKKRKEREELARQGNLPDPNWQPMWDVEDARRTQTPPELWTPEERKRNEERFGGQSFRKPKKRKYFGNGNVLVDPVTGLAQPQFGPIDLPNQQSFRQGMAARGVQGPSGRFTPPDWQKETIALRDELRARGGFGHRNLPEKLEQFDKAVKEMKRNWKEDDKQTEAARKREDNRKNLAEQFSQQSRQWDRYRDRIAQKFEGAGTFQQLGEGFKNATKSLADSEKNRELARIEREKEKQEKKNQEIMEKQLRADEDAARDMKRAADILERRLQVGLK